MHRLTHELRHARVLTCRSMRGNAWHSSFFLCRVSVMSTRPKKIIGWISAILVSAFTLMSAVLGILMQDNPEAIAMGERLGITGMATEFAITKVIIVALFLFPRTSTVGFVLMIGYYGGVLATNITHGFTFSEYALVLVVFALLTLSAWARNPELLTRLKGKPMQVEA